MFIEKPLWVSHELAEGSKAAIYSIDIHPTGTKFATSGGDNNVKIWSTSSLFQKETAIAESSKQLLATLTAHQQAVNSVRWSHSGRFLASGSDDCVIILYELKAGQASAPSFGSNHPRNIENWCQIMSFRGHTMDIQDIAWSPDDRLLASCSIDNQVLIWLVDGSISSSAVVQPLKVLTGHQGWVKGIAWDPVGKYLASAGDDKSVIVWRVEDWEIEERVESPFENSTNSTHFYRISWSPDGSNLCTTNAFKSKQHVAALIERSTWENKIDLVGHRDAVCSTRFNPRLFVKDEQKKIEYACCAIAGEDSAISVWVTKTSRPLAIIKDSFNAPVMDLAWSSDGYKLYGCSLDGTICCFEFEKEEIGIPLSREEQSRLLQKKYGIEAGTTTFTSVVENAVQLKFEETPVKSLEKPIVKRALTTTASVKPMLVKKPRADGKRRIAPILITSNEEVNNSSSTDPTVTTQVSSVLTSSTSSVLDSTIVSESINPQTDSSTPKGTKPIPAIELETIRSTSENKSVMKGTKRQRPQTDVPSIPKISQELEIEQTSKSESFNSFQEYLPKLPVKKLHVYQLHSGNKADRKDNPLVVECRIRTDNTSPSDVFFSSLTCSQNGKTRWIDRIVGQVTCISGNENFTAVALDDGSLYLLSPAGRRLVSCLILGGPVAIMESSSGKASYLLVILVDGSLKVWNISGLELILSQSISSLIENIKHSDHKFISIVRARLNSSGLPILSVLVESNDSSYQQLLSYTYHHTMKCWTRIADQSFIHSDFYTVSPLERNDQVEAPIGILSQVQTTSSLLRKQSVRANLMLTGCVQDTIAQRNTTRAHLEHQISSCLVLESPIEYKYWLKVYVQHLSFDCDESRLREICKLLIGPPHTLTRSSFKTNLTSKWMPLVLGMSKRRILQTELLPLMAKNRNLQRLVNEYQMELDGIAERENKQTNNKLILDKERLS